MTAYFLFARLADAGASLTAACVSVIAAAGEQRRDQPYYIRPRAYQTNSINTYALK